MKFLLSFAIFLFAILAAQAFADTIDKYPLGFILLAAVGLLIYHLTRKNKRLHDFGSGLK